MIHAVIALAIFVVFVLFPLELMWMLYGFYIREMENRYETQDDDQDDTQDEEEGG